MDLDDIDDVHCCSPKTDTADVWLQPEPPESTVDVATPLPYLLPVDAPLPGPAPVPAAQVIHTGPDGTPTHTALNYVPQQIGQPDGVIIGGNVPNLPSLNGPADFSLIDQLNQGGDAARIWMDVPIEERDAFGATTGRHVALNGDTYETFGAAYGQNIDMKDGFDDEIDGP